MKPLALILLTFTVTTANAAMYKCKVDGKTTYQSSPCVDSGSEFVLKSDISKERQRAAQVERNKRLADRDEQRRQAKIDARNERMIQAEEAKSRASYANAMQTARQADEMNERNQIEYLKYLYK